MKKVQARQEATRLRTDFCFWGTAWQKRTGLLFINFNPRELAGTCPGCKSHTVLRGQGPGGVPWTRIAQPYPFKLCRRWGSVVDFFCRAVVGDCLPNLDHPRAKVWDATLGYPGEGHVKSVLVVCLLCFSVLVLAPRPGEHGAMRQGEMRLIDTMHTEKVDQQRFKWKHFLYDWLRRKGFAPSACLGNPDTAVP